MSTRDPEKIEQAKARKRAADILRRPSSRRTLPEWERDTAMGMMIRIFGYYCPARFDPSRGACHWGWGHRDGLND